MMIVYFFVCFYAFLCFEFGSSIVYQHSTPGPSAQDHNNNGQTVAPRHRLRRQTALIGNIQELALLHHSPNSGHTETGHRQRRDAQYSNDKKMVHGIWVMDYVGVKHCCHSRPDRESRFSYPCLLVRLWRIGVHPPAIRQPTDSTAGRSVVDYLGHH